MVDPVQQLMNACRALSAHAERMVRLLMQEEWAQLDDAHALTRELCDAAAVATDVAPPIGTMLAASSLLLLGAVAQLQHRLTAGTRAATVVH